MIKDKINIPVFVIHLKHDIEKKSHMQRLCNRYNLSPEFIEAVNGKLLSDDFIGSIYSKQKSLNAIGRELSKGELGCALSHKKIYQKMLDESIEFSLVLEDDVDFSNDLLIFLEELSNLPKNWELILLGHHSEGCRKTVTPYSLWYKKELNKNCILRRPCEVSCGAYGYLIKKKGASKLLNHIESIILPIDYYTGDSKNINLYVTENPVILINNELEKKSNVKSDREELQKFMVDKEKSIKRKISEFFGIYFFLKRTKISLIGFINKVKFINDYLY